MWTVSGHRVLVRSQGTNITRTRHSAIVYVQCLPCSTEDACPFHRPRICNPSNSCWRVQTTHYKLQTTHLLQRQYSDIAYNKPRRLSATQFQRWRSQVTRVRSARYAPDRTDHPHYTESNWSTFGVRSLLSGKRIRFVRVGSRGLYCMYLAVGPYSCSAISGCPVHKFRAESSLNLCTGQPPTGVMIPDAV